MDNPDRPARGATGRMRLDALLVSRGFASSRDRAQALILGGHVRVEGMSRVKPGSAVRADAVVTLDAPDHPWVGRGALKLVHALDVFGIHASGRRALDIGASTGGFTQVLLERGAAHVIALDVGRSQLDWRLRSDPRVQAVEGFNARRLTLEHIGAPVDLVTVDVSFISLRLIVPVVPPLLAPGADVVTLVKPQFEAGREEVGRGGLVRSPVVHERVVDEVTRAADASGLARQAMTPSPIEGAEGNREFLLHFRRRDGGE